MLVPVIDVCIKTTERWRFVTRDTLAPFWVVEQEEYGSDAYFGKLDRIDCHLTTALYKNLVRSVN